MPNNQTTQAPTPTAPTPASSDTATHPANPTPNNPPAPIGQVHRVSGISVKTQPVEPISPHPAPQRPVPPLDMDTLTRCWSQMLDALQPKQPKLCELLQGRELRLDENKDSQSPADTFTLVVSNGYVESEIKPHLLEMLTHLRTLTGHPQLNCIITIEYEEKEAVIYTPRDKYDTMSKANPALETFRILFPEVDY